MSALVRLSAKKKDGFGVKIEHSNWRLINDLSYFILRNIFFFLGHCKLRVMIIKLHVVIGLQLRMKYTFLGYYEALLLKAGCSQGSGDLQSSYCLPDDLSDRHPRSA